jgi:hypothetical protein
VVRTDRKIEKMVITDKKMAGPLRRDTTLKLTVRLVVHMVQRSAAIAGRMAG